MTYFLTAAGVNGSTNNVSSISALQTVINNAEPGDSIILADGSYTATSTISIQCVGTSNAPILIQAQSTGGAAIGGNYSFNFQSPAAWVTLQGFYFTHAGDQLLIDTGTSHCRLTHNVIQCTIPASTAAAYVLINGDDVEFDHNELRNKNSLGQGLDIKGDGNAQVARRLWVHHNYFHDFLYQNGNNGAETIRYGLSSYCASTGNGLMEYNLFDRCDAEAEMISNKSCGNTYRYNTFMDTVHTQFKIRQGTNVVVYGNYFTNTAGLCIYGNNQQVFDNYFINNSVAIQIGSGDTNVLTWGNAAHNMPVDCVIAFNTLINNTRQYWMNPSAQYSYGASNTLFANNIIVGSAKAADFQGGHYYNGAWTNNLIWNTTAGNTSPGDMPSGAYTKTNPLVTVKDAFGIFHIASNSPAIGAAAAGYTSVTVDMDGQPRPITGKDVGADQYSSAPITARFLTTNDVGPFSVEAVALTFAPPAGTYTAAQSVTISAIPAGASIRYTTDGTTPSSTAGTIYSGQVTVSSNLTLKAMAFGSGMVNSAVTSGDYTIHLQPQITSAALLDGSFLITFTATATDIPSQFILVGSTNVLGPLTNAVDANIISISPAGTFQARTPVSGNLNFYRVMR